MNGVQQLPARPKLEQFTNEAKAFVQAFKSGDPELMRRLRRYHPRLPGRPNTNDRNCVTDGQIMQTGLLLADARLVIARQHQFETWRDFAKHLDALNRKDSPVAQFEAAVDAIVSGDVVSLRRLLRRNPDLIRARSTREHRATLLHYVGANAVEGYRQKTPKNAVQVAKVLLEAGAEVDADLDYGSMRRRYPERDGSTTLGLVATSCHPAAAGVQIPLLDLLLEHGAAVDGLPGCWNPLLAALHNGRGEAAAHLARRGARLNLEGAIGTGRLAEVKRFFGADGRLRANATKAQLEAGMMWACQYGHAKVVDFVLKTGVAVEMQPQGETGLHWAAFGGHAKIVKLLLKHGAPVNIRDHRFSGTPLGWALYGWCGKPRGAEANPYYEVVARLVAAGATVDQNWLEDPNREMEIPQRLSADRRMRAALDF